MTTRQIIREIESLPLTERQEIVDFLAKATPTPSDVPSVQYVDHDKAMAIADRIFTERAELFKKLAA